jgi:Tol biopolymer transport system component
MRRRPAWWTAGSPLDVLDRPRVVAHRTLSLAAVLALIAMVLGVALFAGSHPRLPLPLGRNGLLVAGRPGELLLIDPNGTTVARTTTGELPGFGAWSHGGTRLAHADGTVSAPQLVITDPELRELLRLPLPASSWPFFSWSPDDRYLTFSAGSPKARVYVIDVAAGAVAHPITDVTVDAVGPVWSPDGGLIAMRAGISLDQQALYVVQPDGTGLTRLSRLARAVDVCKIAWTPDGRSIVFGTAGGVYAIWAVDRDGSHERILTSDSVQTFCPSISPDGTRIAGMVWQDTGLHLTVQAMGGQATVLTPDGPLWGDWAGVWAPDGRTIAMNGRVLDGGPNPRAFIDPDGIAAARTFFADDAQLVDWQRLAP